MITLFRREIEAEGSSYRACRLSCLIDIGATNGSIRFVADVGQASCFTTLEVNQRECHRH